MDITIGSLELNRSHPAHIGTRPLINGTGRLNMDASGNVSNNPVTGEKTRSLFENYLLAAAGNLNDSQIAVTKLQEQVIMDPDSVDIHDVTTAMAKARMTLNLAQTVIDRIVNGWQEISQNR